MANKLATFFGYIQSLKPYQIDNAIIQWKKNSEARGAYAFQGSWRSSYGPGFSHYLIKWRNELINKESTNK